MRHDNPGAWPDQGENMSIYRGIDDERLYTTAEMEVVRLQTVEKCLDAISDAWADGPVTRAKCISALEKIREEINNERLSRD